jgi:hypothetical protein
MQGELNLEPGLNFNPPTQIILAVIVNLGFPNPVIKATRAYIEFALSARRRKHTLPFDPSRPLDETYTPPSPTINSPARTRTTLELMEDQLQEYRENRDLAFGTVRPDTDKYPLPREHSLVHNLEGIIEFAALDALSSDAPEHLHIDEIKDLYRRSNKVDPEEQMHICRRRMQKCAAVIRVLEGRRDTSLKELGRAATGRRKVRCSRHQRLEAAWRRREVSFPFSLLSRICKFYPPLLP